MRAERMLLLWDSHRSRGLVNRSRERRQLWTTLDAHPEYARRFRRWEKAIRLETHLHSFRVHRSDSFLDLRNCILGPFTNKFQRHMQRLRPHPSGMRSKSVHSIHEERNALAEGFANI